MGLFDKIKRISFEERTLFVLQFSMFITLCVGIGKFVFGIVFKNPMFGVSGVFSVFMCLSKVECYLGAKTSRKTFKSRNNMIAIFLLIASLVYIFYSARLVFMDFSSMSYPDFAAIIIAAVSFVELGIAIYGLSKVKRKGHYFRNIKIINFASALTAIVLTEIALLSFASDLAPKQTDFIGGISGIAVGAINVILAVYIFFAPKTSVIGREHNIYKLVNPEKNNLDLSQEKIVYMLNYSKLHGDYYFEASYKDGYLDGHIIRGKKAWHSWPVWGKVLLIIFSEILIFVFAISRLEYFFRTINLPNQLHKKMESLGFIRVLPDNSEKLTKEIEEENLEILKDIT